MALDSRYIQMMPLMQQIWDRDLNIPLAGGVVYFFEDENRTIGKDVFAIEGSFPDYTYVNLGSVLTLSAIGTFVDHSGNNIIPFLYPFTGTPAQNTGIVENYFVQVYSAGGVTNGIFQFSAQGLPFASSSAFPGNSASTSENVISNPQFVEVSFNPLQNPVTISTNGTGFVTQIAPDWSIITNGTGTFQIAQIPVASVTITNPSYVLQITNITGYSGPLILNQTLVNSSRTFANQLVSGLFIAASTDNGQYTLTMSYVPSATGLPQTICAGTTLTTGYVEISNSVPVLISPPNTGAAPSATVSIQISIPVNANVRISSVQLCAVSNAGEIVAYLEESSARQEDHLFHYYKNSILIQPKSSILTGWNFPLNPWQFNNSAGISPGSGSYTADQTIVSMENNGSLTISALPTYGFLSITPVALATQQRFALIQYIDPSSALPNWGFPVSSIVNAYITTSLSTSLKIKMRLIWSASLPSAVDPIASWGSVDPIFTSQWTAITPPLDPVYTVTTNVSIMPNYAFNNIQLPAAATAGGGTLGIVIYAITPLGATDVLNFPQISLVPNEFGLDVNAQTYDTVLRECQFYYEKSYAQNAIPGTPSAVSAGGCLLAQQHAVTVSSNTVLQAGSFGFPFKNICRTKAPTVLLYSPITGTLGNVRGEVSTVSTTGTADITVSGNWTQLELSSTGTTFSSMGSGQFVSTAGTTFQDATIIYHYTRDGRLGLVA